MLVSLEMVEHLAKEQGCFQDNLPYGTKYKTKDYRDPTKHK